MQSKFFITIISFVLFFLSPLLRAESAFQEALQNGHLELKGSIGGGWLSADDTSLHVTNTETDRLTFDNADAVFASLGLAYAYPLNYRFWETWRWFPEITASFDITEQFETTLDGDVDLYGADYIFAGYDSKTDVSNTNLMVNLSLDVLKHKEFSFFVIGGIGAAWTDISYAETPDPGVVRGNISLDSKSCVTFAIQVGGGIGYQLAPDLNATLTYLYTDLGSPQTGDMGKINGIPHPDVEPITINLIQQSILLGLEYAF